MRSPIHREIELINEVIEPGLAVYQCPISRGIWIPIHSYLDWLQKQGAPVKPLPENYQPETISDADRPALICPESGTILTRYRVGHGLDFQIDHCYLTGGIWLDRGEWEALKSKGLHDHLTMIFTAHYQHKVRDEAAAERHREFLAQRLGADTLNKLDEFCAWVGDHPERRLIVREVIEATKD